MPEPPPLELSSPPPAVGQPLSPAAQANLTEAQRLASQVQLEEQMARADGLAAAASASPAEVDARDLRAALTRL